MRLVKLGLISVVVLFVVATLIGLLLPSTVVVSRALDVSGNKDSILRYMSDILEWKQWIKGMNAPGITIQSKQSADLNGTQVKIVGMDSVSVTSAWTGKNGTTQESVMRAIQGQGLACVIQWQFTEKLRWYPWQRLGSMMNETVMGTQLEENLASLKKLIEKQSSQP